MESFRICALCFTFLFIAVASQTTTEDPDPTTEAPTTEATTEDPITSTTTPPDDGFNCTADGVFAHPNCEYYYSCINGIATLIKCQGQFLFDLRYYGCNYPEYTDCGDRIRPPDYPGTVTPPEGSTTPGSGFVCPTPNGNHADPNDCTSFYQCSQGIPYHQTCPPPLRYDIDKEVCNHPGFVNCGNRPLP